MTVAIENAVQPDLSCTVDSLHRGPIDHCICERHFSCISKRNIPGSCPIRPLLSNPSILGDANFCEPLGWDWQPAPLRRLWLTPQCLRSPPYRMMHIGC